MSPSKSLTIQEYNRNPQTMGAFANGYPNRTLAQFKELHADDVRGIASLTEDEYKYATQLAVWASCGQLAVSGTSFTAGRASLVEPTADAQKIRVYDSVKAILRLATGWTKNLHTGLSIRAEEDRDVRGVDVLNEYGLEGAAADNEDGIKKETIGGKEYYTRVMYVSSATSTWIDERTTKVYSTDAPQGTIFTAENGSPLALLPAQKEFTTEDGLTGTLTLKLDTVQVDVAGYGSSTRAVSATRSYPNLSGQDTSYIPKTITDNGRTLELASIDWQTDNTANEDGYAIADRYTAIATYTGSATSSYVKGYVVTADYSGTVSRIALNKVRYVAIFEGTPLNPVAPEPDADPEPSADVPAPETPAIQFNWAYVLVPLGVIAAAGAGIGVAIFIKERRENNDEAGEDESNG